MNRVLEYKGYLGAFELDEGGDTFHGRVINTRDVISFYGNSAEELRREFENSVETYLAFCAERGEEPDKPFSGKFLVRVSPEVHRALAMAAARTGKSLNKFVSEHLARDMEVVEPAPADQRRRPKRPAKRREPAGR